MRLDKLTIGSGKDSPTHQFKNLKNVTIDFDQGHWVTVVIGWNGTGKSNVLEALAIIFRDLFAFREPKTKKRTPEFAYQLDYNMGSGSTALHIHIDADPDRDKDPFIIYVATDAQARGVGTLIPLIDGEPEISAKRGKIVKLTSFLSDADIHLPHYVFSYYSGESRRMYDVFRPYLESYDEKLRNGINPGLKRLFYAMPVHSQFVLLAFMIQQSDIVREFLIDHLGLDPDEGIESVLFVLKQPGWSKRRGNKKNYGEGDDRFWGSKGVVQTFLDRLQNIALAPIRITRDKQLTLWNKESTEFQYLFVKDIGALRQLVGNQAPSEFFRDLESTYVSELIEDVRIRVRLKKNDSSVTFRELSEGEQQLLTVLGLLRFTAESESLFLLDEPDTHLNPRWSADYLNYLQKFVGQGEKDQISSHIVFTTHNPLAIAELVKQQVQILKRDEDTRRLVAHKPELDPRGMGYAGIVTSDMFGLASALDSHTQELLEEKRLLSLNEEPLTNAEREKLESINLELEGYGFRYSMRDPIFEEYLRARYSFDESQPHERKMAVLSAAERKEKAKELILNAIHKVRVEQSGDQSA